MDATTNVRLLDVFAFVARLFAAVQNIFQAYKGKEHRLKRGLEKKYGEVFVNFLNDDSLPAIP